MKLSHNLTLQL